MRHSVSQRKTPAPKFPKLPIAHPDTGEIPWGAWGIRGELESLGLLRSDEVLVVIQ